MDLGERIKQRRAHLGMTQLRLAELLGRSASTVRSWERGAALPPDDAHDALAAALGIDMAELRGPVDLAADDHDGQPSDDGEASAETPVTERDIDAEPVVDQTTVMGEGIAMAVPLTDGHDDEAAADPENGEFEDDEEDVVLAPEREDDTGESDIVEAVSTQRSFEPRVLGVALSTDVVPDLEQTKVVAAATSTQVIGSASAGSTVASPFPEARPAQAILPAAGPEGTNWSEVRTYQVRRILTIAGFVGLLVLLRWSMGGFAEGFNTLKDSILSNVNL